MYHSRKVSIPMVCCNCKTCKGLRPKKKEEPIRDTNYGSLVQGRLYNQNFPMGQSQPLGLAGLLGGVSSLFHPQGYNK